MDGPCIYHSVIRHLGCFFFFSIINTVTMNTCIYVLFASLFLFLFLWDSVLLCSWGWPVIHYPPASVSPVLRRCPACLPVLCGNISIYVRNHWAIFHCDGGVLSGFHLQYTGPASPQPHPHLLMFFFHVTHSVRFPSSRIKSWGLLLSERRPLFLLAVAGGHQAWPSVSTLETGDISAVRDRVVSCTQGRHQRCPSTAHSICPLDPARPEEERLNDPRPCSPPKGKLRLGLRYGLS